MVVLFNITTAIFAFGAAIFWWWSASIRLPLVKRTWDGLDNMEKLQGALSHSARMNRYAVICAGFAAFIQALSVVINLTCGAC